MKLGKNYEEIFKKYWRNTGNPSHKLKKKILMKTSWNFQGNFWKNLQKIVRNFKYRVFRIWTFSNVYNLGTKNCTMWNNTKKWKICHFTWYKFYLKITLWRWWPSTLSATFSFEFYWFLLIFDFLMLAD